MKNQYRFVAVLSLFIALTSVVAGCSGFGEEEEDYNPDHIDESSSFQAIRVQHLNGKWISIGSDSSHDDEARLALVTSDNGRDWTSQVFDDRGLFYSAAYGNGRYVVVGGDIELTPSGDAIRRRSVAVSTDGRDWDVVTKRVKREAREYNSVVFGNGVFLAATTVYLFGVNETIEIHRSVDGVEWEVAARLDAFAWEPTLAWNPIDETFLLSAGGTVGHSSLGETWSLVESGIYVDLDKLDAQESGMVGLARFDCCFGEVSGGLLNYIARVDEGEWTFEETRRRIPDHIAVVNDVTIGIFGDRLEISDTSWDNWGSWSADDNWGDWELQRENIYISGVAAADGIFVAAGYGLMYSEDGRTWTDATIE